MPRRALTYLLLLPLSVLYFTGLDKVPFHPDEATFIYTSQEFDTLTSDPLILAWEPGQEETNLRRLRLLDEPVSRLFFGAVRTAAGISTADLNNDWDWSADWETNLARGAMPDTSVLVTARATITSFTFLSIVLILATALRWHNLPAALIVLALYALNALVLLHGRRAMRDGMMLFTLALVIWMLPYASRKPWGAGLVAALALAARYSLAPLVPVAFLASIILPIQNKNWRRLSGASIQFAGAFSLLFLLLHPVLWKHPVQGLQEMVSVRAAFTQRGVETLEVVRPDLVMDSWQEKASVLLYHTFLSPPAYFDVGNYAAELAPQIAAYEANPIRLLWRGLPGGALFLFLSLTVIVLQFYRWIKQEQHPQVQAVCLVRMALLLQILFVLVTFPIPAQRYYLNLLPLLIIVVGSGFASDLTRTSVTTPKQSRGNDSYPDMRT